MPIVSVRIPQIGEGLQEARLVAVLKQPGEFVKRDEPIYQMETDKAVMDVESPYEGVLSEWLAPVDTILAIGAEVAKMEVGGEVTEAPAGHGAPAPVADDNTLAGVFIPQIGEGLQEARLVAVLKQPGDHVKRDEPIYQMETDKAVMDVESPYEGVLVEWLAPVDTVLAIGAEVARMKVAGGTSVAAAPVHSHAPVAPAVSTVSAPTSAPASGPLRNDVLPPRSRAYAAERGLSEADLAALSARIGKIMPSDIDAFLAGGTPAAAKVASGAGGAYSETTMNQKQRLLASRLVRGSQLVVPGTMTVSMNWEPVEQVRAAYKSGGGEFQPSSFTMFAYAAVQALKEFPAFRSSLKGDDTIRTYDQVNLGVAVALPGDELVIAVVDGACQLGWMDFANKLRERIELARSGTDQAHEGISVSLTNMQSFGIRDAVAVVVPPAVATIFLGEPHWGVDPAAATPEFRRCANLGITFDHRLINGVGAALFQNRLKELVEGIDGLISV